MRLKSYYAGAVEAAIGLAAKELGEEAMLVYSREASPEARHLGKYEVVFAVPEAGSTTAGPSGGTSSAGEAGWGMMLERMSREFGRIRREMERLAAAVRDFRPPPAVRLPAGHRLQAWLRGAWLALAEAQAPAELAFRLLEEVVDEADRTPDVDAWARLRQKLEAMIQVDSSLGAPGTEPRVVAVVGPPGVGKTTSLVKLAATYGLAARRPAHLISFDSCRIGGADQLRTFAGILGIGFTALETAGALAQAMEEHRHKELILIDTPGICGRRMDAAEDLAAFLGAHPAVDVHLTLTASTKPADLSRAADRFARFRPNKLLFTRLDETSSFGPIWGEAVRLALPISFLSDGQQIPEEFRPASREEMACLVLGNRSQAEAGGDAPWQGSIDPHPESCRTEVSAGRTSVPGRLLGGAAAA